MYYISNKPEKLTFDWLFSRINQEDVFLRYLGFCELNKKFVNPLRKDSKADCSFYWHQGTLFFNDIARKKAYTCVTVIMEILKLNYFEALEQIYQEFIGLQQKSFNIIKTNNVLKTKQYKDIQTTIQPFTNIDINYLKQFGITSEFTKKAHWFSIKHYWIDKELMYTYSNYNPCIGYYFPIQKKWKLYFYLNKNFRFISNTNYGIIQGLEMLPNTGDNLIITKSFKDVGTLYEQKIPAIAPQAESVLIKPDVIDNLKQRFTNIYSLFDYDNTGIHLAWQMRKIYDIKPLFFTDKLWNRKGGYMGCKDCSDFRKKYNFNKLNELIQNTNERI
jgi:hypothetical protein